MATDLESRFHSFMATMPDAESIDHLIPSFEYEKKRRADYLLSERRIILELKSLESDTSPKIEKEMDQHRDREDFPVMYGSVELQKILKHLPDGEEINRRIFYRTTRSVEDAVRSAEQQIRHTTELLKIEDAVGFLVILNEQVDILGPEVVAHRVGPLMCRSRHTDELSSTIDFTWLIFESHTVSCNGAHPSILLKGPRSKFFPWFIPYFKSLEASWAQFNNKPLMLSRNEAIQEIRFSSANVRNRRESGRLKRHELWAKRYDANPYLRGLSDDEVLTHGGKTLKIFTPYFTIGGPRLPLEKLEPLMVAWSDFLQETRHRGLDLRKMPKA